MLLCFFTVSTNGESNVKYLKDSSGVLDKEWVHNLKIAPFNFLSVNGRAYEYETNTIWNKMYRASLLKDNEMWFDPKARKGQDVIFNAECLQLTHDLIQPSHLDQRMLSILLKLLLFQHFLRLTRLHFPDE